eukprot:scpid109923/ scgid16203/ 
MSTNRDSTTMAAVESDEQEEERCGVSEKRFPTSNCCSDFQNALAVIMDMLDAERGAAADHEKRLINRIDLLTRTFQELSRSSVPNIPNSGSSVSEASLQDLEDLDDSEDAAWHL